MQPNNGLAHPTSPFVPLRGTAGTFGVGQVGSGGTGETPSQLLHISGKSRLRASGAAVVHWNEGLASPLKAAHGEGEKFRMRDDLLFV